MPPWSCTRCGTVNAGQAAVCVACGTANPAAALGLTSIGQGPPAASPTGAPQPAAYPGSQPTVTLPEQAALGATYPGAQPTLVTPGQTAFPAGPPPGTPPVPPSPPYAGAPPPAYPGTPGPYPGAPAWGAPPAPRSDGGQRLLLWGLGAFVVVAAIVVGVFAATRGGGSPTSNSGVSTTSSGGAQSTTSASTTSARTTTSSTLGPGNLRVPATIAGESRVNDPSLNAALQAQADIARKGGATGAVAAAYGTSPTVTDHVVLALSGPHPVTPDYTKLLVDQFATGAGATVHGTAPQLINEAGVVMSCWQLDKNGTGVGAFCGWNDVASVGFSVQLSGSPLLRPCADFTAAARTAILPSG
jgi:hypothetical protein